MKNALIGHTGFVGSTLDRQFDFTARFNSKNINEMRNHSFDLIVCAGAPGSKWKANAEPEKDKAAIQSLIDVLRTARARHFILISTVDVYKNPRSVDESSPVETDGLHAYGAHRYLLENAIREQFDHSVVRLPGLFGDGLKKNILFDFLTRHQTDKINPASSFQFYNLAHLWADLCLVREAGLRDVHLVTEPVGVSEIHHAWFKDQPTAAPNEETAARYDIRTKHASLWKSAKPFYICSATDVLSQMGTFIAHWPKRTA